MKKYKLIFVFDQEAFEMAVEFEGTWVGAQKLGLHLARKLDVSFLIAKDVEEDDLK